MENLLQLWGSSGLAQMAPGQAFMILIGLLLLFLAIRRGFEPLLLVPIGFGGILANIPGAGLAYSAVENALYAAEPALLREFASILPVQLGASAAEILAAYEASGFQAQLDVQAIARDAGFSDGMLQLLYRGHCQR